MPRCTSIETDRRKKVDEYAACHFAIAPWKAVIKKHETLGRAIKGWFSDLRPEADTRAEGNRYVLLVSPAEPRRQIIDMPAIFALLGKEKFLALASITLDDLEKALTPDQLAGVIATARTGPRHLEPLPIRALEMKAA